MRKKNDFSKLIVTAVVIMNAAFTAAVLYVFLRVGSEPTVLRSEERRVG